ncbi:hypothetical protein KIN20_021604 [Parelaphostrongylus tenuis]|uniref:Uncharacterized protein n=1 Tax=Parelaphostrongylus tenuis TaxID=148309 RepID=A0AAD5MT01_PARTN|nr:hypothetical protein KIN20_021604 [Parelaphostrongylus tenuis]
MRCSSEEDSTRHEHKEPTTRAGRYNEESPPRQATEDNRLGSTKSEEKKDVVAFEGVARKKHPIRSLLTTRSTEIGLSRVADNAGARMKSLAQHVHELLVNAIKEKTQRLYSKSVSAILISCMVRGD